MIISVIIPCYNMERNNPLLGTKDKMLRCARLGMIYRDYKELRHE